MTQYKNRKALRIKHRTKIKIKVLDSLFNYINEPNEDNLNRFKYYIKNITFILKDRYFYVKLLLALKSFKTKSSSKIKVFLINLLIKINSNYKMILKKINLNDIALDLLCYYYNGRFNLPRYLDKNIKRCSQIEIFDDVDNLSKIQKNVIYKYSKLKNAKFDIVKIDEKITNINQTKINKIKI